LRKRKGEIEDGGQLMKVIYISDVSFGAQRAKKEW
jgi:hypothetical protein